jgi:hypothetical protein
MAARSCRVIAPPATRKDPAMDGSRLDLLARSLARTPTRRRFLAGVAGLVAVGGAALAPHASRASVRYSTYGEVCGPIGDDFYQCAGTDLFCDNQFAPPICNYRSDFPGHGVGGREGEYCAPNDSRSCAWGLSCQYDRRSSAYRCTSNG